MLDLVCIGRASVDLYGEQVGGRLEDMASFAKYVGGCPTNVAIGAARLGLRSGLITRVGDEHLGRFIKEQLAREGVDTRGVATDPERLTALVILGIRDETTFPLIFYRENCADGALDESDIDEALIAQARAVLVTGTHFSRPNLDAASRKAMRLARKHGAKVVLDIDYRPVLWGLAGHGQGEQRFVAAERVSAHVQSILPACDLIVGTEEELHVAGGSTDTSTALCKVRELAPRALIVLKRGALGCIAFPGPIPVALDQGVQAPGFPVQPFNVLGAGDAFLSGFLRGWLRDLPLAACCRLGNACGAIVVSRHGCAPAMPTWPELENFLEVGSLHRRLREDPRLEHLHWATTRSPERRRLFVFAFDHRWQLEELCAQLGASTSRLPAFKRLAWTAARQAGGARCDWGVLIDGELGEAALAEASGAGCWIGRPIEQPGSRPLRFEGGPDLGSTLRAWPVTQCVKCLVFYHPDDPDPMREEQEAQLRRLFDACRRTGHELLLEVLPHRSPAPVAEDTLARAVARIYGAGLLPDWWKLPDPGSVSAWRRIATAVARHDPRCRGVLLLGRDAAEPELEAAFARAAQTPICKGFAVGRTIFGKPAEAWLRGQIDDARAVELMADAYRRMIATWERLAEGARTP